MRVIVEINNDTPNGYGAMIVPIPPGEVRDRIVAAAFSTLPAFLADGVGADVQPNETKNSALEPINAGPAMLPAPSALDTYGVRPEQPQNSALEAYEAKMAAPPDKPKRGRPAKAETPALTPAPAPIAAPAPTPTPEPSLDDLLGGALAPAPAAPARTPEQLQTAAKQGLMKAPANVIPKVRDLLASMGAVRLADVPDAKLPEFVAKLEQITGVAI